MNIETKTYPDLMTEAELIDYLRIPEVTKATKQKNVVDHLKRVRDLPRIHLCHKALYPLKAVREWVNKQTTTWK